MTWICPKCETENSDKLKVCEVCNSPREKSPEEILKERLKEKYPSAEYRNFIRYHYKLLDKAEHDNSHAQYEVAEWFLERSSEKYYEIAKYWLIKAAENGYVNAQIKLAECYAKGEVVPRIKSEALKWYKRAESNGNKEAQKKYLSLKYDRSVYAGVIQYRLSLLAAADSGEKNSQCALGDWFNARDYRSYFREEAVVWYIKAAQNGHTLAMYKLGECYENGCGVFISKSKAITWYQKAANAGSNPARLKIAEAYLYGSYVVKDVAEAVKWYNMAGGNINGYDLYNIGYAYETGDSVPVMKNKAIEYYRKAASQGHKEAQNRLEIICRNDTTVSPPPNSTWDFSKIPAGIISGVIVYYMSVDKLQEWGVFIPDNFLQINLIVLLLIIIACTILIYLVDDD